MSISNVVKKLITRGVGELKRLPRCATSCVELENYKFLLTRVVARNDHTAENYVLVYAFGW
jgi:hypothetical protein